ncbi:MAG TPA: hypothetical protein VGL70_05530 [Candidatus Binatia bacterium]|jgi:hypothetical protein
MEEAYFLPADASLPAQYWDTVARKDQLEPEKKLLLAVLENAIRTYRQYAFTPSRLLHEVENWLFSEEKDHPFSFETICDALGLNAECVRRGILRSQSKRRVQQASPLVVKKKRHLMAANVRKDKARERQYAAL